jgi:hypothetical protein
MLLQPETRPISQERLVAEVKTIYAGLVMVEAKCIEVVGKQVAAAKGPGRPPSLNHEQWRALVALHRNLLYDHHDFFLASQHPSASPALRRLAIKYTMPARMWRHAIHSFLELLRHSLPQSLEHMLAFVYLAYSMMALLYETVPAFEDTWIECLGDLGRYRMAIEDKDLPERETWTSVARFWYGKAADKDPRVGRLYHHLAILARPHALRQLYYYARSLTCVHPFLSARESILTLFEPILKSQSSQSPAPLPYDSHDRLPPNHPHRAYHLLKLPLVEEQFVRLHGELFTSPELDDASDMIDDYLAAFDELLDNVTERWKEHGVFIAVANAAALFEYGSPNARLRLAFEKSRADKNPGAGNNGQDVPAGGRPSPSTAGTPQTTDGPGVRPPEQTSDQPPQSSTGPVAATPQDSSASPTTDDAVATAAAGNAENELSTLCRHAAHLAFGTLALALRRADDANALPFVHVSLVLLKAMACVPGALEPFEKWVPWNELAAYLNKLALHRLDDRLLGESFPGPRDPREHIRPLREDFAITGQVWTEHYLPEDWFRKAVVDDEDRDLELPSMSETRRERVLWLAVRIAKVRPHA